MDKAITIFVVTMLLWIAIGYSSDNKPKPWSFLWFVQLFLILLAVSIIIL